MGHAVKIAQVYIDKLNYHIFPVRRILNLGTDNPRCDCQDESCPNTGKHPRIAWSKTPGTADMWEKWPMDGFGIATGIRSGIWVLDVDPKNDGFSTLAALEQTHSPLPKTISVRTGSGGFHFYFSYPGQDYRNTAGQLGPGLDTRGDGGYVVGPGSLHRSGNRYTWQNGPGDYTLAEAPGWLLHLCRQVPKKSLGVSAEDKPGMHSAGTSPIESAWLLDRMLEHPLIVWMMGYPDEVDRETWRGIATNFAAAVLEHPHLLELARNAFHTVSKGYTGYKEKETEKVFMDSVRVAQTHGPMSFEHMKTSGMPIDYAIPQDAVNLLHSARIAWYNRFKLPPVTQS